MDIDVILREWANFKTRLKEVEQRPHAGEMADKIKGDVTDWQASIDDRLSKIEAALSDLAKPQAVADPRIVPEDEVAQDHADDEKPQDGSAHEGVQD
jgi:hypothetical protein